MKKTFYLIQIILICLIIASGCGGKTSTVEIPSANNSSTIKLEKEQNQPVKAEQPLNEKASQEVQPVKENLPAGAANVSKPVPEGKVHLVVSRDFGRQLIFDKKLDYEEDAVVLDIMKSNLQIETSYGGSFINSINGLVSSTGGLDSKREDWFYYINGICCDVGAADYDLKNAAVIWWDFHSWQMGPSISAVIGSYPEPFLHGYRGNVKAAIIISAADDLVLRQFLQQSLASQGIAEIKTLDILEADLYKRQGPTIVIGQWDKLKDIDYLDGLNKAYKKNGTSIHFSEHGMELLNSSGKAVKKIKDSAGIIVAAGEGLGDDSPLWLISGTDQEGTIKALNVLINNPDKIKGLYGAAVLSEGIQALPMP